MPLSWVAALDFTFQQASYAKFILGHALASGSHCKSIPVKYPVCYQTSCNGNYFVPPEFPDDNEVVESSIKNSLLYALTVLILCLGCCDICGLILHDSVSLKSQGLESRPQSRQDQHGPMTRPNSQVSIRTLLETNSLLPLACT